MYNDPDGAEDQNGKIINYLEKALMVDHTTCKPIYDLEKWTEVIKKPDGKVDISIYENDKVNKKSKFEIKVTDNHKDQYGNFEMCDEDFPKSGIQNLKS